MSFAVVWPYHVAYGILVPPPGIKPAAPAVEAGSLNHWPAREVLAVSFIENFQVVSLWPQEERFSLILR